jgi:hypothetical protein
MTRPFVKWTLVFLVMASCGEDAAPTSGGPVGTGHSSMLQIGPAGGQVTLEGATLTVPAGAVPNGQQITITSTTDRPPADFTSWASPIYRFEPSGLTFAVPATVQITFSGDATVQTIYWTNAAGTDFMDIGGNVSGSSISAQVTHFSRGFVSPRRGPHKDAAAAGHDAPVADAHPTDAPAGAVDAPAGSTDAPISSTDAPASQDAAGHDAARAPDAAAADAAAPDAGAPLCLAPGQACGAGSLGCCAREYCVNLQCHCQQPYTLCGQACVDLSSDPANCSGCGRVCASGQVCNLGTCSTPTLN